MHSIRQIRIVKTLAHYRHFGRAANALGVSQPNLTRSLKQIEEDLGVQLFERQGVTPTLFGEIVLRFGDKAIAQFQELTREIKLARGLEIGELRVVMGPYPSDISGYRAVGRLVREYPRLFVDIRNANWEPALADVLSGAADLAFAETAVATGNSELQIENIRHSQMKFFCAADHPLAKGRAISLDQLLEYPWTGPTLPARIGDNLPKVDERFAVYDERNDRFYPRALVGSFAAAKAIAISSHAVSAAIPSQIEREVKDGVCVMLDVDAPWLTLNYGFVFKRGRSPSPAALAFMEHVRTLEKTIPP
jgi:DNA-binding transcriptional LysR family regulator